VAPETTAPLGETVHVASTRELVPQSTSTSESPPAPVLHALAVPRGRSLVVLCCPYCGREHTHGLAGSGGARVAHCTPGTTRSYRLHVVPALLEAGVA
jgi:hypothetical protein